MFWEKYWKLILFVLISLLVFIPLAIINAGPSIKKLEEARDIAGLTSVLSSSSTKRRESAYQALVEIGEPSVEILIETLKDNENEDVRSDAARALGEIGDERAIEPLFDRLINDDSLAVKESAKSALVDIGEPAVDHLVASLTLYSYLEHPIIEVLGRIGEPAIEPLVKAFCSDNSIIQDRAASALLFIGEPAAEQLLVLVRDQEVAERAVKLLDDIGWEPDNSEDAFYYWAVKGELVSAAMNGGVSVEHLIEGVIKNEDAVIRKMAARALKELGEESAREPLLEALKDNDPSVRANAATALGIIRDSHALEALIDALSDENPEVRVNAATALGLIGDTRALGSLITALEDEHPFVQVHSAYAIAMIGGEEAIDPLIQILENDKLLREAGDLDLISKATDSLYAVGEPAVEPLIGLLHKGYLGLDVHKPVVIALGQIGDERAVGTLVNKLQNDDLSKYAVTALAKICEDNPVQLVQYLKNESTLDVYKVLIKLGDETTVSALMSALKKYGTKKMATDYLNCGHDDLEAAAKEWASANGYQVMPGFGGSSGPNWGH